MINKFGSSLITVIFLFTITFVSVPVTGYCDWFSSTKEIFGTKGKNMKEVEANPEEKTKFTLEKNGRDFDKISIHSNNEEWLFTECSRVLNPEGDCHVLRFNINSKQLQRYILPDGYLYSYASFSPQGNYIVMSRSPKHDGSEEKIRQSFENGEIVLMRSDGTDFKVLSIPKGRNLAPVMSKDETKIAYWRSSVQRPSGSKSVLANFDVREYDLRTGQDSLFAGPFHFFEGGNSQYVSENEIIIGSYGPEKFAQSISDYQKKFNGSQVYKLRRGAIDLPDPSFTNIEHARNPSIDQEGVVYLVGQPPSVGSAFLRVTASGKIDYWPEPINLGLSGFRHIIAAPDGHSIAFIYVANGSRYGDQRSAMGLLDIVNSRWLPVNIPPLQSSVPLVVKTSTK